jgi:hypothetical protein
VTPTARDAPPDDEERHLAGSQRDTADPLAVESFGSRQRNRLRDLAPMSRRISVPALAGRRTPLRPRARYNVSAERIRQLEQTAMKKLRAAMAA